MESRIGQDDVRGTEAWQNQRRLDLQFTIALMKVVELFPDRLSGRDVGRMVQGFSTYGNRRKPFSPTITTCEQPCSRCIMLPNMTIENWTEILRIIVDLKT